MTKKKKEVKSFKVGVANEVQKSWMNYASDISWLIRYKGTCIKRNLEVRVRSWCEKTLETLGCHVLLLNIHATNSSLKISEAVSVTKSMTIVRCKERVKANLLLVCMKFKSIIGSMGRDFLNSNVEWNLRCICLWKRLLFPHRYGVLVKALRKRSTPTGW